MGLALALGLSLCAAALAAEPTRSTATAVSPVKRALPGEPVELKTKDGWTLAARYQPAKEGRPTALLLHAAGGKKEDWMPLVRLMNRSGYGTFALDLRGHGESLIGPDGQPSPWRKFQVSRGRNPWSQMALDVEAAVGHLLGLGLAESSIPIGGADFGASLALKHAATRAEAPMVFLLSPGMSYKDVNIVNAVRAFGPRPMLLVVGSDDQRSVREAAVLFEIAKYSIGPENASLIQVHREHGTRMLFFNKSLPARIVEWIANPVRAPEGAAVSTDSAQPPVAPSTPPEE